VTEAYEYKGQHIEIRANQKTVKPETWEMEIWITGTRHLLTAFDVYPPRLFPTSEAAVRYGKKAAQYIVDRPTKTKEKL
jgi:hypothetical protein